MTSSKTCRNCNKSVGKKLKLYCGVCQGHFHLHCENVTEVDARIMQADKTPWNCTECRTAATNRRQSMLLPQPSNAGDRRRSALFGTGDSNGCAELKSIILDLQSEIREMRSSMEFFNVKYEEEARRTKVLTEMVSEISKENQQLKKDVLSLKKVLNVQEQGIIKNNICVTGLITEEDKNNNVASSAKLLKLFKSLNVAVTDEQMENKKYISTSTGVKVVVALDSADLKLKILKARAAKGKITLRSTGFGEAATPIFVEEELTKETYNLFKKTKEQLKARNYKYIWHRNGKILARKNDGDRYFIIRSEEDLSDLL